MAASRCEIRLDKSRYFPGDLVTGVVSVWVSRPKPFESVRVWLEGKTELQITAKSVGLFDTFTAPPEAVVWVDRSQTIAAQGQLLPPASENRFAFEFPLAATQARQFMETLHGMSISTSYSVSCEVRRGMFARTLAASCEFQVQFVPSAPPLRASKPCRFRLNHAVQGELASTVCALSQPITGHVACLGGEVVSVDLELLRVEHVFWGEEEQVEQVCVVKRSQIVDGPVLGQVEFALVIPHLLASSTTLADEFSVTYQLAVCATLTSGAALSQLIPITLYR